MSTLILHVQIAACVVNLTLKKISMYRRHFLTELESVLGKGKDGISETKLILWMRGAKQDWLAADSIQSKIDESSKYCKGNEIEGHVWSKGAWENVIHQSVKLSYVNICFNTFELKGQGRTITRTYRTYKLTSQGGSFLANPVPVSVMSPFKNILNPKEAKQVVTRKRRGRGCHYLPRIKDMLKNSDLWRVLERKDKYKYPGFFDTN